MPVRKNQEVSTAAAIPSGAGEEKMGFDALASLTPASPSLVQEARVQAQKLQEEDSNEEEPDEYTEPKVPVDLSDAYTQQVVQKQVMEKPISDELQMIPIMPTESAKWSWGPEHYPVYKNKKSFVPLGLARKLIKIQKAVLA